MSSNDTATVSDSSRAPALFFMLSIYLIAMFLWRVLTPAHEYPMRAEQVLTMGLDLLGLIGLFAFKSKISKGMMVLFWLAVAAGVGLFAIRLTGDAAWWTGHLVYTLPR